MATGIPKFFVMEYPTGGPYLCPVEDPEAAANQPSHFLKFDETQIFSPRAKFATKATKTGDPTLVHIVSCLNNKYWVAHETGGEFLIAASADKPEEDATNPGCTLFRVSSCLTATERPGLVFLHFRSSSFVSVFEGGHLTLSRTGLHQFPIRDWETLVILPSHVTFKTEDDRFMSVANDSKGESFNWFEHGMEITDSRVVYQLFPTCHGYYRIKSLYNGKFWKRVEPGYIRNDNGYSEEDPHSMFEFIVTSDNRIALRNLGNNLLCGWDPNWLNAKYSTVAKETRFIIGEPVLRRDISISDYHVSRSKIYDAEVLALAEVTIQNRSPDRKLEQVLKFSKSVETTKYWNHSASVNFGVSIGMEVKAVPFITEGKVKVSVDTGYKHKWADSEKKASKIETGTKVVVPTSTNMKVTLLCTKATCNVPFSYTITDVLPDGRKVSTVKDDGIFTGVNAYEFNIKSMEVDENGTELKFLKVQKASLHEESCAL